MAEDQPRPATELFPLGSVQVPISTRLRLARAEATAGADGSQPRRTLLRDASGVLMVVALIVFVVGQSPAARSNGSSDGSPTDVSAGAVSRPMGTLDLWTPTPAASVAPRQKQRVVISKSTPPPWCADPQCTHFVTPSPSPSASPRPTPTPNASGSASPSTSATPPASSTP